MADTCAFGYCPLIARAKARKVLEEYDPSKPGDLSTFGHPAIPDLRMQRFQAG